MKYKTKPSVPILPFNKLLGEGRHLLVSWYRVLLACLGIIILVVPAASAQFRAAVVKVDITPQSSKWLVGYGPRQSTGVHDRLYSRILVLDDGASQFYLVQSDLCVMSPSQYDHTAALLKARLGINPLNFWWSLTHTHAAPEVGVPGLPEIFMGERYKHEVDTAYASMLEQTLLDGIIEARKNLQAARLGVGWGFSQANINRRAIDTNGRASLGMNPDGAVDRRIGLIRIDRKDGSTLALIANYPIHGTVLGDKNFEISGDAPGIVSEYVERKIGAPVLFINGAAGNLAPIYSVYPTPGAGHLTEFRVLLGDKILDANRKLTSTTDTVNFSAASLVVETPRKTGLGWPSDLSNYTIASKKGKNMVRLPVRFLKINKDLAIWSAPLELFCEISNEVRDRSPFPFTYYFGYTNGWLGYLPTAAAYENGGYEVETVNPYTPAAAKDLTESVIGYIQGEMRGLQ